MKTIKNTILRVFLPAILITLFISIPSFAGQWKRDTIGWWYRNDDGSYSKSSWQWIERKCYYFNKEGYCLINTETPDGYTVDKEGAWHINGEVQMQAIPLAMAGKYSMKWGNGKDSSGEAKLNINYLRDSDRLLVDFDGQHAHLSNGEFKSGYTGYVEGELFEVEGKPFVWGFHPREWEGIELLYFLTYDEREDCIRVDLIEGKNQTYFGGIGFPGFEGNYKRIAN